MQQFDLDNFFTSSKPGVILDDDKEGSLVSLEVLDASERVSETHKIEFQTTG